MEAGSMPGLDTVASWKRRSEMLEWELKEARDYRSKLVQQLRMAEDERDAAYENRGEVQAEKDQMLAQMAEALGISQDDFAFWTNVDAVCAEITRLRQAAQPKDSTNDQ